LLSTSASREDPAFPRTEHHVLYADGDLSAGMSRVATEDDPLIWTFLEREILLVVSRTVAESHE
jgi:hypothetical protein